LQISESTISRDLDNFKQQSKDNIRKYIDERLPEEYEKCLVGLTAILIQALSLAKDCYSMKLDLLTNATVVDDAIRFVDERTRSETGKRKDEVPDKTNTSITITTRNQVF
jgi:hypothetical protein